MLTDTTAWVAGLLILHFFLADRPILLLLTAMLGSFAWPMIAPMAVLLLAFPRSAAKGTVQAEKWTSPRPAPYLFPAAVVLLFTLYRYYVKHQSFDPGVQPVWAATAPLAAAMVFCYLAAAVRAWPIEICWPGLPTFGTNDRAFHDPGGPPGRRHANRDPAAGQSGPADPRPEAVLTETCLESIAKPGLFLVAHCVYFGPIVLVILLCWPRISATVRTHGLGFTAAILLGLLLSITAESRHLLCFVPLFVAAAVQSLAATPRARWRDLLFVAASVLASKCWLPWSSQPFTGNLDEFPWQYYFMNQGPWMSGWSYAVQGAVVLVLAGLFAAVYLGTGEKRITKTRKNESTKKEKKGKRRTQRTTRF